MNIQQNLEPSPFGNFDASDIVIVRALWRSVEINTPLSPDLAQAACLFDEKHPGTPIYEIIKTQYVKTG